MHRSQQTHGDETDGLHAVGGDDEDEDVLGAELDLGGREAAAQMDGKGHGEKRRRRRRKAKGSSGLKRANHL